MQRAVRVRVVLVKRRRRRVEGDARGAGAAIVLDLEPVEIEEADHVLARRLPVHLHVRVLELRPIDEVAGAADEAHVLDRVGAVEPRLVAHQRPADVEAVVRDLLVVIRRRGRDAQRLQLGGNVRRFH